MYTFKNVDYTSRPTIESFSKLIFFFSIRLDLFCKMNRHTQVAVYHRKRWNQVPVIHLGQGYFRPPSF